MKWIAFAFLLLVGVLALAVAGEAIRKGRFWYQPRHRRGASEPRWIRRSTEPIAFRVYVGFFGVLGIVSIVGAIWAARS